MQNTRQLCSNCNIHCVANNYTTDVW